jgi:hypothetical protein
MLSATVGEAIGFLDYNKCSEKPEVGFVSGTLTNGLITAWLSMFSTPSTPGSSYSTRN